MSNKIRIPDVIHMFKAYRAKPGNLCWGSLHIVLDDGNFEDSSVEFCRGYAVENGDSDGEVLARLLLKMSKTQRKKLYYDRTL